MVDQPGTAPSRAGPIMPEAGYPPSEFVSIYSDGVTSLLPGANVVKFHLSRLEPNFVAAEPNKAVVVGQVTMPVQGFIPAIFFF
jgi:hypothetical protein